jgi:hypothetical protein
LSRVSICSGDTVIGEMKTKVQQVPEVIELVEIVVVDEDGNVIADEDLDKYETLYEEVEVVYL